MGTRDSSEANMPLVVATATAMQKQQGGVSASEDGGIKGAEEEGNASGLTVLDDYEGVKSINDDDDDDVINKISSKKELPKQAAPVDSRLDVMIDEGYLPSAVGTEAEEEELSVKEDTSMSMATINASASGAGTGASSEEAKDVEPLPSVTAATTRDSPEANMPLV